MKGLTLKSLSSTRWESRVDSVKAIRFQILDFQEALLEIAENDNDPKIKSEARSLAENELGNFEFTMALVIWYKMLNIVNLVCKQLQSKDMLIDVAMEKIKGLLSFFKEYREIGFSNALKSANEIALEMNINPTFPQRREIRRKKHFDEVSNDTTPSVSQSPQ